MRRICFAAIAIGIGLYDLWAVRATGRQFDWTVDSEGYYDLLAQGFAQGHLYLPVEVTPTLLNAADPWDPTLTDPAKMHDVVYFNGRYYLYFGAAPAVLLFTPWRMITGHDLPENFAVFLLVFGGFLFTAGALRGLLRLAQVELATFPLCVALLALGICQGIPFLLNRTEVYEIAIACGYFTLSAAIFFLQQSLRSPHRGWWLAASGLMLGLAVASRPHLILAGIVTIAVAASVGVRRLHLAALAGPWILIGASIGLYNYERFENPLEFGFHYQLAGPGQNRLDVSSRNLAPGVYYMLLSPPEVGPEFPFIRMVRRWPFGSAQLIPPEYFTEPTTGALWLAPFFIAALWIPLVSREVRAVIWIAAGSSAAVLLFHICTHLASHRYIMDFLPLGVFAAIANLAIRIGRASGWPRSALSAVTLMVIAYSTVTNLALGIAGPHDGLFWKRPADYLRLAGWFSPFPQFRRIRNPAFHVAVSADFTGHPLGERQPLVAIGRMHFNHFLFVERAAGGLRLVSQAEDSTMDCPIPDHPARIEEVYSPSARTLSVLIDGSEVIVHSVPLLIAAPSQVEIGWNRADWQFPEQRFSGVIRTIEKSIHP